MHLELKQVRKTFGQVPAIQEVSFGVEQGEFFTLLGPSGSGKSTILRLIAGFELPDNGEILLKGEGLGTTPPYRRPVNTVFQHYALFPHLSVFENVAFGLRMRHLPAPEIRGRVEEALAMVHMGDAAARQPHQLSGGEQQRVALARALINRPELLLLDEPLGSLDLKLRQQMQAELKSLQHHIGITFVYVTHDQHEALALSDRVAVMDRGRVLQVGTPAEIYERPRTRFVAEFVGQVSFLSGQVQSVGEGFVEVIVGGVPPQRVPASVSVPVGSRVLLLLRPEWVQLDRDGNGLPGRVVRVLYHGGETLCTVCLEADLEVVARSTLSGHHIGEEVRVSWDPAHHHLLPDPS
ncbi:MAG: ABC transporter ATP-binding protein [Candidatus Methylomirabilales bacterium]